MKRRQQQGKAADPSMLVQEESREEDEEKKDVPVPAEEEVRVCGLHPVMWGVVRSLLIVAVFMLLHGWLNGPLQRLFGTDQSDAMEPGGRYTQRTADFAEQYMRQYRQAMQQQQQQQ